MASVRTAPVVAAGLTGGYAVARYTGRRELAGVVYGGAGAWSAYRWLRTRGPGPMGLLLGLYLVTFGVSHPLAKRIGAWPSVLAVTAVAGLATHAVADHA